MAPEVYNNQPYGAKADIYSLGLVLYWLLNERRTPFLPLPPAVPSSGEEDAARRRRFRGEPLPPPAHGSPALQRIVLKACAYAPKDRYQNAEELLRDLENLERGAHCPESGIGPGSGVYSPEREPSETPGAGEDLLDRAVGAGLAPARREGYAAGPAEDGESTQVIAERRLLRPEAGAPKAKKKKAFLLACCAVAAVALVLILLLLPRKSEATVEPTTEPTSEQTLDPQAQLETENAAAYEAALALADSGKTYEAALAFYAIKDYRDSWDRCFALWGQITTRETVSAGMYHTVGLRSDGTVVAAGEAGDFDLGQCEVSDWRDIVAVSGGNGHTVGLRSDGTVLAVGYNRDGQCNVSDWRDIVAVSAGWYHTVGLRADGTVVAVGYNNDGQVSHSDVGSCDVGDWRDIVAVSAGSYFTVGLRADGTVVAVGYNSCGECDVGDWRDIVAIWAGVEHTVGLHSDGTVVAVGYNSDGQCDVSDWRDIVAVSAGWYHTVGLRADGTVVGAGWNDFGRWNVDDWRDVVAVSDGRWHTAGLCADGTVVAVYESGVVHREEEGWTEIAMPEKILTNLDSTPAPTPEKRPSSDDINQTGNNIEYPRDSEYYDSYQYAVVVAPKGYGIYGYTTADHSGRSTTVLHGETVTMLAERNGWVCVIVQSTNTARWVNKEHLEIVEP
jgi:hypothetical protein